SWTPWYGFIDLPSATAFELPAGAHIVADIYYQRSGKPLVDRGTLGLFFGDKPAPNTISDLVIQTKDTGTGNRYHGEARIALDTHAVAVNLDLSRAAKSVEVSARRADGGTDVLLFAKDFPAAWPTPFIFKQPVLVHRGSTLAVTAYGGPVKLTLSKY